MWRVRFYSEGLATLCVADLAESICSALLFSHVKRNFSSVRDVFLDLGELWRAPESGSRAGLLLKMNRRLISNFLDNLQML